MHRLHPCAHCQRNQLLPDLSLLDAPGNAGRGGPDDVTDYFAMLKGVWPRLR